jgi:hypothetical protein
MGCGASSVKKENVGGASVDIKSVDEYEGMTYWTPHGPPYGQIVQHFDLTRDAEEASEPDKEAAAVKAKEFFTNVAKNTTIGAVTGAPGIVFGAGGAIATKATDALSDRRMAPEGAILTFTAVRVADLYNMSPVDTRAMSVLVRGQLIMRGVDAESKNPNAHKYRAKTQTFNNGGTNIVFPKGEHSGTFSMPMKEYQTDAANNACLLLSVEDQPEVGVARKFREVCVGTAVVALGQLVDALEDNEEVTCPVNLAVMRGEKSEDYAGLLRVTISIKLTGK